MRVHPSPNINQPLPQEPKPLQPKEVQFAGMEEELFFHTLDAALAKPHEEYTPTTINADNREKGILIEIGRLVEEYLALRWAPVNSRALELMRSSYDAEDILEVLKLVLGHQLTMGPRVAQLEKVWASWLGANASLMVNSGSSANLLGVAAFCSPELSTPLKPGDEVIVPAVCWSTTVFPFVQHGCVPVFVDVDVETLNIDPSQVVAALSPKTKAIAVVHVLGNPCPMPEIMEIARANNLLVLEDCCEAHGASIVGRKVGTFGDIGTFSFFFSHHMTTIEGGMISFSDTHRWKDILISLRAHGWIRGRSDEEDWVARHPDFDRRWLFVSSGYNLRPTEINAVLGLSQLRKLDRFIANRRATHRYISSRLEPYSSLLRTQKAVAGHSHSGFGISMLVQAGAWFTRDQLKVHLEAHGIQTRPVLTGNMLRHPVKRHIAHKVGHPSGRLANADQVHLNGLMVGNHHNVTASQQEYLGDVLEDFLTRH